MPERTMKEYVVVPPALLKKPALMKKWIASSLKYVMSRKKK